MTGEPQPGFASQPSAPHDCSLFKSPKPKKAKNRVHLDLVADDRDAEVARLQDLGATVVARHSESDEAWTVMRDPYGNEFCVN